MCDNRLFHDFPRLAKESGFYFNYRPKLIDWSQIDNIDLEDIAKHKRFELLEEKLEFVTHCELDDGITKVLDCNFVKLFRLAQLSVSYLRHCQFYLDRGIVLLQEQLTAALKEAESIRNTVTLQNSVKCLECDKTFMTSSYLESHQRRRHSSYNLKCVSIAVQTDPEVKKIQTRQNTEQQTEIVKTVSSECQTNQAKTVDVGLMTDLETQNSESVNIMQRFESLYQRIELIEKQTSNQKQHNSCDLATLLQSILPLQHHTPTFRQGEDPLNICDDKSENKEKHESLVNIQIEPESIVTNIQYEPKTKVVTLEENGVKMEHADKLYNETPPEKIAEQNLVQITSENNSDSGSKNLRRVRKKVNMLVDENTPVPIPRPRPRKSAITRQTSLLIDFDDTDSDEVKPSHTTLKQENTYEGTRTTTSNLGFNKEKLEEMVPYIELPTPVVSILEEPKAEEIIFEKMTVNTQNDTDSIIKDKDLKVKPKSIFKTFVKKSSPKFKGLRKSIRKSWSNFSDSKLFNNDNMLIRPTILNKNEEGDDDSSSDEMILPEKDSREKQDQFDKRMRELGIDPEWSGIPENSYTRIQATLDQRAQLLAKKSPEYLRRRHDLEALITQRMNKANKDNNATIANKPILMPEQTKMYDIESESESESHPSPIKEIPRNTLSFNSFQSLIPDEKNSSQTLNSKNSTVVEIQTGIAGSDSSDISEIEKENKPPVTLKSSILTRGKDEIKKKVVFADNFQIETSHDLMKTPNSSDSSTSSSDWDIPMP